MTAPAPPLSGRRVVAAGLISGAVALAIALFLRTVVATTPARVSPQALFWSTVLASGFGLVAGMAVEAVRQLQQHNPACDARSGQRPRRRQDPNPPRG